MHKLLIIGLMLFSHLAIAGSVEIVKVKLNPRGNQQYGISVTLLHADSGWKHYADGWEVLDENKQLIATRVLAHPHVNEQPFTRSLYNVVLKSGAKFIYIRAHDSVHGYSELRKVELN